MTQYTSEESQTLEEIRGDVLWRPDHYEEGKLLLATRYSPSRIRARAMQEWKAHQKFLKDQGFKGKALASMLPDKPGPESWSHGACFSHALSELRDAMAGPSSQAEAKAVLLLAVMMKFTDADRMHSVLDVFGPWGTNEEGQATGLKRWVGQCVLHGESELRFWMENVRVAWFGIKPADVKQAASSQIQIDPHKSEDERSFTISDLRKMIGCSTTTVRRYAQEANVQRPARGQKNFRYSQSSVKLILEYAIRNTGEDALKEKCLQALHALK